MVRVIHFLILLVCFQLAACRHNGMKQSPASNHRSEMEPVPVRVQKLEPVHFDVTLQVAGVVKAFEDVYLSPEEGGVVQEWRVHKGQDVKKGEIIAVLGDEVLRASYAAAEAQYKLAELNFEKQEKIFSDQSISEIQYKTAQYTRDAAKAQAELMKARWQRTQIKSPINGVLDDRLVDEGEFAPPATPIAHIVNTRRVKILAELPERHAGSVAPGSPVVVTLDAVPGDTLSGVIAFVGQTVSPTNRALPVEIYLDNRQGRLKPEMVAKVRVVLAAKDDALLVSEHAVLQVDRDRLIVYVENAGTAQERMVTLGGRQGNLVEIVSGLAPGERVIVSGFQRLVNGCPVMISE
ncbi:MAG: efflux RND transporter periplasmic adaptor subunit [candidate division KSB1 bacterium]|nr:efflux RND transporter periplasmic adaptor subunit [candidate division KSB1 bacterium]MDZ7274276.1 efflux RND transporter periplasmic adaptor subunit [candidate division KSB1 bacterium]MDZ7287202.1 efflux RND transporter periplasmic adaptor subunit [candidate division KSB1 bacterium]MDZ7296873.1 efflux RND transporter periplasmic adaptor subunit [candidate division KSB1 bacterium]MDZ7306022.1 efflux RND transporter periplasmic adaptor subunit [candidate division KSB1 bacterium]